MKTRPMKHQITGIKALAAAPEYFALGAEQGTGKTWMLLSDIEHQFIMDMIDAVLVIAPKGVHTNWVLREIPTHLSVPNAACFWLSGAGEKHMKNLNRLFKVERPALAVLTMNVDAVNTKSGYEFAERFVKHFRTMLIVDESQRIKNPDALRTKKVMALGEHCVSRRIASGTLVANSPIDLFSQYSFLKWGLLGTTSYRAFVAEYAELLPPNSPLVQDIMRKSKRGGTPQIIKRDKTGAPIYRNLDKLQQKIAPHTFRVLKEECLDLPEKIYQIRDFELEPAQRVVYEQLLKEHRYYRADGEIDAFTALTIINKLRQVTSGFILVDGEPTVLKHSKPRMDLLKEIVEDLTGPIIVWANFQEEIRMIAKELAEYGVVVYYGATSTKDREIAVDSFQNGEVRIFVGNPAAAGTGLTLHRAETAIYYSSSFSLEQRLQSEDRCHRIGLKHHVVYIDLVARDTIDERIAAALQRKAGTAAAILDGI